MLVMQVMQMLQLLLVAVLIVLVVLVAHAVAAHLRVEEQHHILPPVLRQGDVPDLAVHHLHAVRTAWALLRMVQGPAWCFRSPTAAAVKSGAIRPTAAAGGG
jgi:hypothetical protein